MADLPEESEIIVCRVTKVLDYGVFVELSEYDNRQGFVHISQVASSWIKNIRNFVKENQVRAAKVMRIDTSKNQIDLSFNKVSSGVQRARIEQWKQNKRTHKLLEAFAKQHNVKFDDVWKEIAEPLLENYDTLYDAFQAILLNGVGEAKDVDKKWLNPLKDMIEKNMEVPVKLVKGVISLSSNAPNGIELIKDALKEGMESTKDADLEVYYSGSGKFMINVKSFDYKVAERVIRGVAETTIEAMKSSGGEGEFTRLN
ncbi:MAG: translation initiation factor IF-2 subunit alpha [Candidatus Diapherotrites archaeon]